jgi:hypothetical protein
MNAASAEVRRCPDVEKARAANGMSGAAVARKVDVLRGDRRQGRGERRIERLVYAALLSTVATPTVLSMALFTCAVAPTRPDELVERPTRRRAQHELHAAA